VNLVYTHIVSPIDGRVGLRQVDQGNYVTPGDTNGIVVINQLQPITVIFPVPEDNVPALVRRPQGGAPLKVRPMTAPTAPSSPTARCSPSTTKSTLPPAR
jgi:multidrug efflux pump subunit AcrA (membrane-fusion protein)